jgi:hypothetical protein
MITTSPDGQWAAARRGREVTLLAGGQGPATARLGLDTDDVDLVIVGPPSVLAIVTRGPAGGEPGAHHLMLYQPPYLDPVARLELDAAMRIAAITGPRIVLVSLDGKAVTVVRIAGRALSAQALDPGSVVEFAVGLERNQVLFGLSRKLEAWDAVSGRPLLRMQLQLPPPPRTVGAAHGHVWATRPGSDDIVVCRLSDGRPFRHQIGAPIDHVVCHPGSPLLILATLRGLVRLHCFAHSLTVIDAAWQPGVPLAQLVVGDDISLLGLPADADEPWRVPIGGAGAPGITLDNPDAAGDPLLTAADKLRAMRERTTPEPISDGRATPPPGGRLTSAVPAAPAGHDRGGGSTVTPAGAGHSPRDLRATVRDRATPRAARAWRDPVASAGAELARGGDVELPVIAADTELGRLAQRLGLSAVARRALIALYGTYLVGDPALSIARLAHALGDWAEPLGQGELATLALVASRAGKLRLRGAVSDVLDGLAPRALRLIGEVAAPPRPGVVRLARDARSDAGLTEQLAHQLGAIGVVERDPARAALEAQLHGATAVLLDVCHALPSPWPRDAALIVVCDQDPPAWVAALPSFTAA